MTIYLSVNKPAIETSAASSVPSLAKREADDEDAAMMNQYAVESPQEPCGQRAETKTVRGVI
jgi:hypothetical protein